MWASRRIDALLKNADRSGSRESVAPEVVRLGETFSIVTEYTSFLVLENDAEFRRTSSSFGRACVAKRNQLNVFTTAARRDG